MAYNPYIHRTGARAGSAMKMRNEYQIQFGIQYYLIVEGESDEHFFETTHNSSSTILKSMVSLMLIGGTSLTALCRRPMSLAIVS